MLSLRPTLGINTNEHPVPRNYAFLKLESFRISAPITMEP